MNTLERIRHIMKDTTTEQPVVESPIGGEGFVVRIISPPTLAHSYETHTYPTVEEAVRLAEEVGAKLIHTAVEEFEIHVIDQTTGEVRRTLKRRVEKQLVYENN